MLLWRIKLWWLPSELLFHCSLHVDFRKVIIRVYYLSDTSSFSWPLILLMTCLFPLDWINLIFRHFFTIFFLTFICLWAQKSDLIILQMIIQIWNSPEPQVFQPTSLNSVPLPAWNGCHFIDQEIQSLSKIRTENQDTSKVCFMSYNHCVYKFTETKICISCI